MCDKYHIISRHDIYEARNKHTQRRYARYKATPRRWRELRRSGVSNVDNEALIDTLENAVNEFNCCTTFDTQTGARPPVAVELRHLSAYARPKPREWRERGQS